MSNGQCDSIFLADWLDSSVRTHKLYPCVLRRETSTWKLTNDRRGFGKGIEPFGPALGSPYWLSPNHGSQVVSMGCKHPPHFWISVPTDFVGWQEEERVGQNHKDKAYVPFDILDPITQENSDRITK